MRRRKVNNVRLMIRTDSLEPRRWLAALCFLLILCSLTVNSSHAQNLSQANIILFRHTYAPGVGDPPEFQLRDCATQRNLDETGRAQARRLGQSLQARGIKVSKVLTSQWCRCKETAQLAFAEQPQVQIEENAIFNSFFSRPEQQAGATGAARALLSSWRGPGVLVVVTHQVNITALTGVAPQSGDGVLLQSKGQQLVVLGPFEHPK
jgi:phosphohistidine phosphatase SixA